MQVIKAADGSGVADFRDSGRGLGLGGRWNATYTRAGPTHPPIYHQVKESPKGICKRNLRPAEERVNQASAEFTEAVSKEGPRAGA